MNDNEKVAALVDGLLREVNASCLPLAVRALALENVLLRVNSALHTAGAQPGPDAPAEGGAA